MQVVNGYRHVPQPLRGASIALGNFDGVHRGHRVLISTAIEQAKLNNAMSGVMVFEPHPREFFQPQEPHFRLTPLNRKLALFNEIGLDVVYVEPFDAALAAMPAEAFIERILVAGLGVRHVVIGYDFYYGNKRGGSPEMMVEAGEQLGFGVSVVPPQAEGGEAFSSSAIRLHLAQGDIRGATRLLGSRWHVGGKVIGGARRGTDMGFPTANIPMPKGTSLGHGIYAVRAHVDGESHAAAAYLGTRPTFDDGKPVLEVYLLDFKGDLYGHEIDVEFIDFIRPDRRFDSVADLVHQMDQDIAAIRAVLAAN